jgi:hypothetical protein
MMVAPEAGPVNEVVADTVLPVGYTCTTNNAQIKMLKISVMKLRLLTK